MKRNKNGPTSRILELARTAPGGVVRWREARDEYVLGSEAAQRNERRGHKNFHMSLKRVLDRYFYKVDGTEGFYVLKSTIFNDHGYEDKQAQQAFQALFGHDEFGQSTHSIASFASPVGVRLPTRMSSI